MRTFIKAILAGICISIGCIAYATIENHYVGAFIFAVGLLSILQYNFNLFTGKVGLIKTKNDTLSIIDILAGNILGNVITYIIVRLLNKKELSNSLMNIANIKAYQPLYRLFILGIFCGVLMLFATKIKDNKVLTILCVMGFILCGFEHSIADGFYLLFTQDFHLSRYVADILVIAAGNAVGAIAFNRLMEE